MSQQEEEKSLPEEQVRSKVRNKLDYYNAMLLNDYYLMTHKSGGCTI
jgi:hypothetical protein